MHVSSVWIDHGSARWRTDREFKGEHHACGNFLLSLSVPAAEPATLVEAPDDGCLRLSVTDLEGVLECVHTVCSAMENRNRGKKPRRRRAGVGPAAARQWLWSRTTSA